MSQHVALRAEVERLRELLKLAHAWLPDETGFPIRPMSEAKALREAIEEAVERLRQ